MYTFIYLQNKKNLAKRCTLTNFEECVIHSIDDLDTSLTITGLLMGINQKTKRATHTHTLSNPVLDPIFKSNFRLVCVIWRK